MKIRGQEVLVPAERIMRLTVVDPVTGCWNWTGSKRPGKRAYGRLTIGSRADRTRRSVSAHRYAYEVFVGPVGDEYVCHRCDNPGCVNPEHLFLGTAKDNADDRDSKGRNSPPPVARGSASSCAKLTEQQVAEIRSSPVSSRKLASLYGISDSHIRSLRRGNHFPSPPTLAADEAQGASERAGR